MKNNDLQRQLSKLRRNKKLLWLGVLFLVLIILWILVSIFATSKTSSISPELRELAKSFVPRLESKVFEEISQQRAFTQEELNDFSIFVFDQDEMTKESILVDITKPEEMEEAEKTTSVETNTEATAEATVEVTNDTITEELGDETNNQASSTSTMSEMP